jgi:hypothetical protein
MWVGGYTNVLGLHLGRIKLCVVIICWKIRLIISTEQCSGKATSSSFVWEISCSIWYMKVHFHVIPS